MLIKRISILFWVVIFTSAYQTAFSDTFYKELNLIGGYSDNNKWIGKKNNSLKNSLGFEYYKKFSDEYGDFLTVNLQVRFAYDSIKSRSDAFGVEFHNAWLEYKLGLAKSIRIGHFSPAFGLEPVLDTHSTLLQTLAAKNIGFKKDWGIAYKGILEDFDYEIAAQLGSGMGITRQDQSYLLSTRISTPKTQDPQIGLSLLIGRTLLSKESWTIPAPELISDKAISKKRIGIDFQFPLTIFDFKAELAAGDNDGKTVAGGMTEFIYTVPDNQNLKLKLQTMYWSNYWEHIRNRDLTVAPVLEYKLSSAITIRLGYFHDLYSNTDEDNTVLMQFYYFGL